MTDNSQGEPDSPALQKVSAFNLKRMETGPVQFNDDWPGVFIRGDRALYYAHMLVQQLDNSVGHDPIALTVLDGLIGLLHSCHVMHYQEEAKDD